MAELRFCLVLLLGVVSCSHDWIPGSALESIVASGDNITLYCDCKLSTGEFIVWYRNCSHENQPSLVLVLKYLPTLRQKDQEEFLKPLPRFHFVKNHSSDSYDLLIMNMTSSDEGLYYCGTEKPKVGENDKEISLGHDYKYGKATTRILLNSTDPCYHKAPQECRVCWTLLFCLCPACAVLSSLLSSLLVYCLCQKKANVNHIEEKQIDTGSQTKRNQDEDVCYAALEFHQPSRRPKKKNIQSSDFSTYSAINTPRM